MPLTRQATWKSRERSAIVFEYDGRLLAVPYSTIENLTEAQIEGAIVSLATGQGIELPSVHIHWNDDGSVALAFGEEPAICPEDQASD